ncbi:sensor histidine kinase [Carboxylicivirga sp. N1Y90]|uniref:sensor histidine kinase n=1 Tax=Carboxylicivirga fragile TaxID=3417571 RepID=UPI003D336505|nr:histidine kinase [Marinilabiliaceae bacterium N1Y90]
MRKLKNKYLLLIIYSFIWGIVFYSPVLFINDDSRYWNRLLFEWLRIIPFFVLFLINALLLTPRYFKKKSYHLYLIFILLFTIITAGVSSSETLSHLSVFGIEAKGPIGPAQGQHRPYGMDRPDRPNNDLRPPRPERRNVQKPPSGRPVGVRMVNNFITALLMLGFYNAVFAVVKLSKEEQQRTEMEKQQLKTELDFLKHQISPHFFMNTLNNIHALIDINSEDAKSSIIRLSRMMRYLLYESDNGNTSLSKEIEFTKSFLDLMRIRFSDDKVKISANYPESFVDMPIPAFLFVSYIENAFKHGINPKGQSFINLEFKLLNNAHLSFKITNSNFPIHQPKEIQASGVGLVNSLQRLKLLYDSNFSLNEESNDDVYSVNLIIPLDATEKSGN